MPEGSALTLEELHHLRRRIFGRDRQVHVHMIGTDRSFDNRDVTSVTQLNKNLFQTGFYVLNQDMIAILGYPYEMVLTPVDRMRRPAVTFHRSPSDSKLQQLVSAQQQGCFAKGMGPPPPYPTTDYVNGFGHE